MKPENMMLFQCLLFSFFGSAPLILNGIAITMAVPIGELYNKTSAELFGVDTGGNIFFSIASVSAALITIIGVLIFVPFLDFMGRKFVCVHLKFILTSISAALILSGYIFQTAILFVCGATVASLTCFIKVISDPLYLPEITDEKHKGYIGAASVTVSMTVAGVGLSLVSTKDTLGTSDRWYIVVVIAMIMNFGCLLVGRKLPNTKSQLDGSNLLPFVKLHCERVRKCFTDSHLLRILIILTLIQIVINISPLVIEEAFPIQLLGLEGATAEQVLQMTSILMMLSVPYHWIAPIVMDKWNKKFYFIVMACIIAVKTILHLINIQAASLIIVYANGLLQRVIVGSGQQAFVYLLITDLVPEDQVVAISQITGLLTGPFLGTVYMLTPLIPARAIPTFYFSLGSINAIAAGLCVLLWKKIGVSKGNNDETLPLLS